MRRAIVFFLAIGIQFSDAQNDGENAKGIIIITSGGKEAERIFIEQIGDPNETVVFIPTPASSLRSESGVIWNPDQEENKEEFKKELLKRFRLNEIIILHTRDRKEANKESFCEPLNKTKAVWISGGNAGRFTSVYRGTKFEKALKAFVNRGGLLAGESAGAIVQGSYTIRGNPNKPVLMAKRSERGFGILSDVAINPHLSRAQRENELVTIIDIHPNLLGVGIDDDTGFLILNGIGEVFGDGKVAIYDNKKYKNGWYYWLKPGDKFDFINKKPVNLIPQ